MDHIFVSHNSSKKAKKREAKRRKQEAKRAKSLPSPEAVIALETSTLRSLNLTDRTASTLFSGSIESIPSTIHESEVWINGSRDSMNQTGVAVVSYHNWN